jgi:hypothetical protein
MGKHHDDGTKITLENIRKKLKKDDYGPEVTDTIKFLVDSLDENTRNISLEEYNAIEALIYAARGLRDGRNTWVTVTQAINHLDKVRGFEQDIIEESVCTEPYCSCREVERMRQPSIFDKKLSNEFNDMLEHVCALTSQIADLAELLELESKLEVLPPLIYNKIYKKQ